MKQPKEYTFKNRFLIPEIVLAATLAGVLMYMGIKLYREPFIMLFACSMPGFFLYFYSYVIRIMLQFYKYDKDKKIIISDDRLSMQIIRDGNITTIKKDGVEKVEIYEQKWLGKFARYNYMVIYLTNSDHTLITQFTIPRLAFDNILATFLSKKPRTTFYKRFNYIDESKFKLT